MKLRYIFVALFVMGTVAGVIAHRSETPVVPLETWAVVIKAGDAHGSGVYIGNGEIITAAHVASHASSDGVMSVVDGSGVVVSAEVKWMDEKTDVALLKVGDPRIKNAGADLACGSPDPKIGDVLEAIGSPSVLVNAHTYGQVATDVGEHELGKTNFIGDLTISGGSSGGPVFSKGKVVGISIGELVEPIITPFGLIGQSVPLAVIVPRSVICKELKSQHEAPKFDNAPTS